MQKDGVGLYRALGWRGTERAGSGARMRHAAQEQTSVLAEKSRGEKGKVTAGRSRCRDMPAQGAEGETGQGACAG